MHPDIALQGAEQQRQKDRPLVGPPQRNAGHQPAVYTVAMSHGTTPIRPFAFSRVVLPVVRETSPEQGMREATAAYQAGADGVFIISGTHGGHTVLDLAARLAETFPSWWIGVNLPEWRVQDVFRSLPPNIGGVWADDAQVKEYWSRQFEAERIQSVRAATGWRGLYFGGVAFKYQTPVRAVGVASQQAAAWVDVVTTSGHRGGIPPGKDKVMAMKRPLGDKPLAIASGISTINVSTFLPYADMYIVRRSILNGAGELDATKVATLVEQVHGYHAPTDRRPLVERPS